MLDRLKEKIQEDCQEFIDNLERNVRKGDDICSVAKEVVLLNTLIEASEEPDSKWDAFTENDITVLIQSPNLAWSFLSVYYSCEHQDTINICNTEQILHLLLTCARASL